jgi:hypothetical protein
MVLGAAIALASAPIPAGAAEAASRASGEDAIGLHAQRADYDAEPRLRNGRVDVDGLVARLRQLGVTTYYWLIFHAPTDWDDLELFLPKAAEARLKVWVYLVPPSESPPHTELYSEPFRCDYQRWAEAIARLSLQHPNLTGWVIDDFYANHRLFTPTYVGEMRSRAQRINPGLAFLPLMYFGEVTPQFVQQYCKVIDGVVVAYPRDRSEIDRADAILRGAVAIPGQLNCPWETHTSAGDFTASAVSAKVLPGDRQVVRFRERDDFHGTTSGYHFKQLLVDDVVVWEEDVAGGKAAWRDVAVDVRQHTGGKANVTLTFRLLEKKGVSNFGVRWDLADLQSEGLRPAADLRQPQQWRASHRGPLEAGFGAAAETSRLGARIPYIVMTAADVSEFRMRHGDPASPDRIAEWLRMCLQAQHDGRCDGIVTYCLDKRPHSTVFPPVAKAFRERP